LPHEVKQLHDVRQSTETPFFFEHEGSRLFAVLYEPTADGPGANGRGILFCAPFAEEAAVSQRVCVDFARLLARRGYHALRFDYRGCGESQGDFEDVTLDTHLEDIRGALNWFRRSTGVRVGLSGLRLGASLAAMTAATDRQIDALLLWEPVASLKDHLKNFVRMQVVADNTLAGRVVETRRNLLGQMEDGLTIDVLGYPFTPECFRGFSECDVLARIGGEHGPTLVIALGRQKRPRKDLQAVAEVYERRGQPVEFQHVQELPFWIDPGDPWRELASWQGHDELFRRSADWLDRIGNHASL